MKRIIGLAVLFVLAGCGGSSVVPAIGPGGDNAWVVDAATSSCSVSAEGIIWYTVPAGGFSPVDARHRSGCGMLQSNPAPAIPAWAKPSGANKGIFVATSLQEDYSLAGMQSLEQSAAPVHVPMTWMIGNDEYLANASLYSQYHTQNGDDVQAEPDSGLISEMQTDFPWYKPTVSVDGAGHERDVQADLARGETGFWGITWDSQGIDGTSDEGAPWGTYCADPTSYKRPDPDGTCPLLAFEWTARDLTRAYQSGLDYYYSTDPDDLQERAGFTPSTGSQYVRSIVDAYAAAAQTTPLVVVSQQESQGNTAVGDPQIMSALYAQAVSDGLKLETLSQANTDARAFSALPRAVAFPFIPGGLNSPSILDAATLYPATIDFHDTQAGMTFLAGHTMPSREYIYANDPISLFNVALKPLTAGEFPTLTAAAASKGELVVQLRSPGGLHFGIALWTDATNLGLTGPNVSIAGHAGAVITFNLQPGVNQIVIPCSGCTSTTFPYST